MLRLIACVTLRPGVDVERPMALLRAMAEAEPNVSTFEVGRCEPTGPDAECATYAYTATFDDRAAYERYATGLAHDEVAAKIAPLLEQCVPALYVIDPA